jgi:16S rRNA (guanine(966)-N(2))-methyltransferase RsmD
MSLRIQSGSARGRRLKSVPKTMNVRPILARIRKSLFDILRPRLAGSLFLDLYAGTGTVGLEALSSGAQRVVFVDADRACCRVIQKNAETLGFADRAEVYTLDISRGLKGLGGRKFDLIFMGPPYKTDDKKPLALTVPTLQSIEQAGLLAPSGIVVGQHHDKEKLDGLSPRWETFRENTYGDSVLSFFRLIP